MNQYFILHLIFIQGCPTYFASFPFSVIITQFSCNFIHKITHFNLIQLFLSHTCYLFYSPTTNYQIHIFEEVQFHGDGGSNYNTSTHYNTSTQYSTKGPNFYKWESMNTKQEVIRAALPSTQYPIGYLRVSGLILHSTAFRLLQIQSNK